MAFGKKKDEPGSAPEATLDQDDGNEPLFPADDGSDEAQEDAAVEVEAVAVAEATAPEPAPAANPGADLLSMFQSSETEESDRSVVLELAGEVELADLLEDLQTLAAAMGIAARAA